ncbi:ATP synthase subunit I [Mechercharimyces sp. CAU 1602]|nr:ATP synthase subunit I [Mechercharimyces sp. CAU 1602]
MTNELDWIRRHILRYSGIILTTLVLLWIITPYKPFLAGIILGGLVSLYNVLYLARRIRIIGERVVAGQGPAGTGLVNRILMIGFSVIMAVRFPEWIDYRSLVLGWPISYILLAVVGYLLVRHDRMDRKEENADGSNTEVGFGDMGH